VLKSAESPPDIGKTFTVTAALTLVTLPLAQEGPIAQDRLLAVAIFSAVASVIVILLRTSRFHDAIQGIGRREVVLGFILASGVLFRLRALLARRSLWFDEVSLATNIRDRSLLDLLSAPLEFQQSAPPGFLTASWLTSEIFGTGLVWVRTVPFVAGILTLGLGLLVAKSTLKRFPAQAFFMAILALSPVLIFYSSEMKQYSTDALALTAGLYVAHMMQRRKSAICASLLGFVSVISSSAGLIVFFLLAMIVLASGYSTNQLRGIFQAGMENISALSFWLIAAIIHVFYTAVAGVDRAFMEEYWGARGGFAPQTITTLEETFWYGERLTELVWLTFDATNMVGPGTRSVSPLILLAAMVLLIGGFRSASRQNWPLLLVLITCIAALVLAQLRLYPLSSRLAIYLIPALAFLMASGADRLLQSDRRSLSRTINPVAGSLLIASLIPTVLGQFHSPYVGKDMDSALKVLVREGQFSDTVLAVPLDLRIVDWHRDGANFTAPVIAVDSITVTDSGQIAELGATIPPRLWIVSSARRREARTLFQEVEKLYSSTAVYSKDDTFIALLSNIGSVEFELTGDRSLLNVTQGTRVGD